MVGDDMVGTMDSVDKVLDELKSVGAVGGLEKTVQALTTVDEVVIDRGAPSAPMRDLRGSLAVDAVDEALAQIDVAVEALNAMKGALGRLRDVWTPSEAFDEEDVLEGATPSEAPQPPSQREEAPKAPVALDTGNETYERAREAALRKIRGDDIPEEKRTALEEDDDVPYVGQERAVPSGQEPTEVSLGTVGTIKSSFPLEDENGS